MLVVFLNVNVLFLMNDELEIDLHIRQFFHPLEWAFIHAFLVFLQKFFYWLVQNRLNMVNDVLKDFMVQFGKHNNLEKWLYGP